MRFSGQKLKRARRRAGMTLQTLAMAAAPMDRQTVWRYEAGVSTPGSDRLCRLCDALGVALEDLHVKGR